MSFNGFSGRNCCYTSPCYKVTPNNPNSTIYQCGYVQRDLSYRVNSNPFLRPDVKRNCCDYRNTNYYYLCQ